MKAIVIAEHKFDHEFKITLDRLKLERFVDPIGAARENTQAETSKISEMHRAFQYEVCLLKDRLRDG